MQDSPAVIVQSALTFIPSLFFWAHRSRRDAATSYTPRELNKT